ncbi:phage tail assembly chaperone [Burkholderia diffusa]|uniref:phage tail assembly chaperone n=1 Tax=Burkholderia diffusa TaxID=488732 RepID=UPI0009BCED4E|nr:phage tail assembly chaperone [Burkholderia diffusa]
MATALAGAAAGAVVSSIAGPLGTVFGGLAGAVIAGLVGAAAGCASGSTVGPAIDDDVLDNHHFLACGPVKALAVAWTAHRAALRKVPEQEGFPFKVAWPPPPR